MPELSRSCFGQITPAGVIFGHPGVMPELFWFRFWSGKKSWCAGQNFLVEIVVAWANQNSPGGAC